MNSGMYGWFDPSPTHHPVRHGYMFRHPGTYGFPTPGQANTVAMSFSDGTQIGVVVNSASSTSPTTAAYSAYQESWVAIQ